MNLEYWKNALSRAPGLAPCDMFDVGWSNRMEYLIDKVRGKVMRRNALLEVISNTQTEFQGLYYEQLQFITTDKFILKAIFISPSKTSFHPGILVCPGRNAQLDQVAGLVAADFPDRNIAEQLARQGFSVLCVDYGLKNTLESKRVAGRDEFNLLGLSLSLIGDSLAALIARNTCSLFDYFIDRQDVDESRIGIFGQSLGGSVALHTALSIDRQIPCVLSACCTRYSTDVLSLLEISSAHVLPGILEWGDFPDLLSALAPSPLMLQAGEVDQFLPVASAKYVMDAVSKAYEHKKAREQLSTHIHKGGHCTDITPALDFFQTHLQAPIWPKIDSIPAAKVIFDYASRQRISEEIDDCLRTGSLTLGRHTVEFEETMAKWTGSEHIVAVNSGTAALEICLRNVCKKGGTVLIPAVTFFATAEAAINAGGEVEFIDIEPDGLGMCPMALRKKLNEQEKPAAVVVVHLGGIVPPSLLEIIELCEEYGIPLIEDAAHALGSQLNCKPAGSFGSVAAFSMYPTKVATSAEGGFIVAQDQDTAEKFKLLRDHGKKSFHENIHNELGNNWRMSELHAIVGANHLKNLQVMINERLASIEIYNKLLKEVPKLTPFQVPEGVSVNGYKYIALLENGIDRSVLKQRLKERHGVVLAGEVYSIPCCAQPFFKNKWGANNFPVAYSFCEKHICLPLYPSLKVEEQEKLVRALKMEINNLQV